MRANPLSRSYSRATLLYHCAKKYYFNYYTSFLKSFDQDFYIESLILKQLSSMPMWIGQVSHGMMSDYLHLVKNKEVSQSTLTLLKQDTLQEMDNVYAKAKNKDFTRYDRESPFWFSEHFYGQNIDEKFKQGKIKVIEAFDRFLKSDIHQEILEYFDADTTIFIEPKLANFEQMKYKIEHIPDLMGIILRAQPDLGIIVNKNWNQKTRYIIYDWKTWKVPDKPDNTISDQLKVYAYKMFLKLKLSDLSEVDIFCYEIYLSDMKKFGGKIQEDNISAIEIKIIQDVMQEKQLLVNQDPFKNQPLPITAFTKTKDQYKCNYCRFRKVCTDLPKHEPPATLF